MKQVYKTPCFTYLTYVSNSPIPQARTTWTRPVSLPTKPAYHCTRYGQPAALARLIALYMFYHPRLGFGVHNNYVAKHLAQKRGTWRDQGLGKCDFHYMEYIDVTRPNHIEIMPNASWLPLFLVTELWFRHFLEPKLWRWTRTLVQAFPFYFFCPKGSKRCCTAPNAIDIALESAPLRSFFIFFYAL